MIQVSKLKFSRTDNEEFVKELRSSVSAYFKENNISKYGNTGLWIKAFVLLGSLITPYILVTTQVISSLPGFFIAWFIMGLATACVGMGVMHDANHKSFSKKNSVNKWFGRSLFLLGGLPNTWQHQHNNLHHGYTNIDGVDEDISPPKILRLSPHRPLKRIHRFQFLYAWILYSLTTFFWVTGKDFLQINRFKKSGAVLSNSKSYFQLYVILLFSKIVFYTAFFAVPIILLPFAWYWIVIAFLIMQLTSGLILTTIFETAHVVTKAEYPLPDKDGNMQYNWLVHQLHTTANFSPNNKLLTWFIGGLNYQVEHHLFPNISHVHYPKIAGIVKSIAQKHNIPYHVQPGFIKAVIDHTKMLYRLGRA